MHYTIYIDRVWLMDFVISTYLLLLVRKTYRLKSGIIRLLASAAASAVAFVLLLLLPGIGWPVKLFVQAVCMEPLLLKAAFSFRTKEMVVKSYVCMSSYGLLIGGFTCALCGWLSGMQITPDMWKVLLIASAGAGLVSLYLHFQKRRMREFYTVKLDFYGETLICRGLVDTGNRLYEPYAGRPVSILAKQAAEELWKRVPPEKRYLIPFHSIGKKHGLLQAAELPGMEVEDGEQRWVFRKAVVAMSEEVLTQEGNYQMILHPKFVKWEE